MPSLLVKPCTAFEGERLLATGPLVAVALAVKAAEARAEATQAIMIFDDTTGLVIDLDRGGTEAEVVARLAQAAADEDAEAATAAAREAAVSASGEALGLERPECDGIAQQVTLLPRHWDWLKGQPGGASVAVKGLVDEARRSGREAQERRRDAVARAYGFMAVMAGKLPGFKEAAHALFAEDRAEFDSRVADWPDDIRAYAARLAFGREGGPVPR